MAGSKKTGMCTLVILDSVGIGAMPDAEQYDDLGADTLGNISLQANLQVPHLAELGLGNIDRDQPLATVPLANPPRAAHGRMATRSLGKDTSTGHWEIMGIITETPFKTYPDGFPIELVQAFIEATGVPGILGNIPASGTVIIEELGREHIATQKPIVYTSGDPVFQIAAHQETIPIERLYELCQAAYELMLPYGLSRVIARPFIGTWPHYERTYLRRDFTVPPPEPSTLVHLQERGVHITSVGKVESVYSGQGFSSQYKSKSNAHGVELTLDCMRKREADLVFTNLVDFDSLYGHRRDCDGYARALEAFDKELPSLLAALAPEDILVLTADHGNDPAFKGTDHTREYVPLLVYGAQLAPVNLGTRSSFADLGATLADFLGFPDASPNGTSFLNQLREE